MKRINIHFALFSIACLAMISWGLHDGPQIHPDSGSYISNHMARAPLYPLILDFFAFALGEASYLEAVVCFQLLTAMFGIASASYALMKYFSLNLLSGWALFIMMSAPLTKFGSSILTETISYGLHGFFMAALLTHIFTRNNKLYIALAALAALELLTRPPFLFTFVFLIAYGAFRLAASRKSIHAIAVVAFICVWAGVFLIRNSYNEIHHGYFGQYSSIGEHLLATQLYISLPDDVELFSDTPEREFLSKLYKRIDENHLSERDWDYSRSHFDTSMNAIYFEHIIPVYSSLFPSATPADTVQRDRFCKRIGVALMMHNLDRYGILLFKKVYYGPFQFLVISAILFMLAAMWHSASGVPQSLSYMAASTLTFFNYGMLLPVAIMANRYTLFTDIFQISLTLACGLWALRHVRSKENGLR